VLDVMELRCVELREPPLDLRRVINGDIDRTVDRLAMGDIGREEGRGGVGREARDVGSGDMGREGGRERDWGVPGEELCAFERSSGGSVGTVTASGDVAGTSSTEDEFSPSIGSSDLIADIA